MTMEQPARITVPLVRFVRFLREHEFLAGPGETADVFRALETVDLGIEAEVRTALRVVLCSTRKEQEIFDQLFNRFFYPSSPTSEDLSGFQGGGEQQQNGVRVMESASNESGGLEGDLGGTEGSGGSQLETKVAPEDNARDSFLQAVRFSSREWDHASSIRISSYEAEKMLPSARLMASAFHLKPSRRFRSMAKGRRFDFRRTFRQSVQTGGLMIEPARLGRVEQEAELIFLCDGSRSMFPYAEKFLPFVSAMTWVTKKAEVFLFSTRLRRVTSFLQKRGSSRTVTLMDLGMEWGGGTRIGTSLERFIRDFGPRFLSKRTVVFIFSDGLETGAPETLEWAMKRLYQQANKVIWLNPLAAAAGYEPMAQGMQTALPYIDVFSGAHEAGTLGPLARRIGNGRD